MNFENWEVENLEFGIWNLEIKMEIGNLEIGILNITDFEIQSFQIVK